jgi:hypothetical protein
MHPSLRHLFRPALRRRIALLAALALCVGGMAQAAHFHKSEPLRGTDVHLQCLLCLHADRSAAPPVLPRVTPAPLRLVRLAQVTVATGATCAGTPSYLARGPPAG